MLTVPQKIRNENMRNNLNQISTVVDRIRKRRLQWYGHVQRMNSNRIASNALHTRVVGTRSVGRQKKCWQDNITEDLGILNLPMDEAKEMLKNRDDWRRFMTRSYHQDTSISCHPDVKQR